MKNNRAHRSHLQGSKRRNFRDEFVYLVSCDIRRHLLNKVSNIWHLRMLSSLFRRFVYLTNHFLIQDNFGFHHQWKSDLRVISRKNRNLPTPFLCRSSCCCSWLWATLIAIKWITAFPQSLGVGMYSKKNGRKKRRGRQFQFAGSYITAVFWCVRVHRQTTSPCERPSSFRIRIVRNSPAPSVLFATRSGIYSRTSTKAENKLRTAAGSVSRSHHWSAPSCRGDNSPKSGEWRRKYEIFRAAATRLISLRDGLKRKRGRSLYRVED